MSDSEKEQVVSSQSTTNASAPTATAQTSHTLVKPLRSEKKQNVQNRESSATVPIPSQPMDLSDASARVSLNMKRSPLES